MKTIIPLILLLILGACSKSEPSNTSAAKAASDGEDGVKQDAKSIDAAADEAAALVEEEANEEIKAYDNADAEANANVDAENNSEDDATEGQ